ncbi:MAG: cytidylate kinase-like family protein [Deltaproteobacteria bacterium]
MTIRHIQDLVDRQAQRWEKEQLAAKGKQDGPSVSIHRFPSSGATEIGRRVAEALDFGFFGKEIVEEIAREENIRQSLVANLDEHFRTAIERHILDGFSSDSFNETDYLKDLVHVVSHIGHRGNAVILGRGSAFILPKATTLRVLLTAPLENRVAWYTKKTGLPVADAEAILKKEESNRSEFLKRDFSVESISPSDFDLCLDTATFGIEGTADLIVAATNKRFSIG